MVPASPAEGYGVWCHESCRASVHGLIIELSHEPGNRGSHIQHAYLQEEAEHLRLALSERDSFLEERSRALTAKHAELEDKHTEVLMDLREKEDKVHSMVPASVGEVKELDWHGKYEMLSHLHDSCSAITVAIQGRSAKLDVMADHTICCADPQPADTHQPA